MARLRTPKATLGRGPRVPEKAEQAHIVRLLRTIGASVFVSGTVRRRGDFHGTMQTPGIPDVEAFLPPARTSGTIACPCEACLAGTRARRLLKVEVKARGGRLRPEQLAYRQLCEQAAIAHVVGGLDEVIAWLIAQGYLAAANVPHYRQPQETV